MEQNRAKVEFSPQHNILHKSECFKGWLLVVKIIVQIFTTTVRVAGEVESLVIGVPIYHKVHLGYVATETSLMVTFPDPSYKFPNT